MQQVPEYLTKQLTAQYGEEQARAICQGYAARRPVTLRVNRLKAEPAEVRDALAAAGISFRPVVWSEDAFLLPDASVEAVRALPVYEEGKIYLQSLSSMLPPLFLCPNPGEAVLDMAAAPGGKTTQMAAMTGDRAQITACEKNAIRAERLRYNLQKQGAKRVYVMQTDAARLDDLFSFDKVLLDAPCSGSGTIALWQNKLSFSQKLVEHCVQTQRQLLKKALRVLKPGGDLVYSTCSILAQENEQAVAEALKGGRVELVPCAAPEGVPTLPTNLPGTLCVAPDEVYEGFFVAKLRKK